MKYLALFLSLWMVFAPCRAQAGGASDSTIQSSAPRSFTAIYTGSSVGPIVPYTNSGATRTSPSITTSTGDLLIGQCGTDNGSVAAPTAVGSWNPIAGSSVVGQGGGLGSYAGGSVWVYLYVAAGGAATYVPCTIVNAGSESTIIWDIPAAAVTGTWATDFQRFQYVQCYATGCPATWSILALGHNTIVLAGAIANCVGGTNTATLTGDVTNGSTTNSPTGAPAVGAWVGSPVDSVYSSVETTTGGCGRNAAVAGSVVIN